MHYTNPIWRPPYEAASLLLEATAGCTHHRCKFCTLYEELPVPFRQSPLADIVADLQEAAAQNLPWQRIFLTGANPFVLPTNHLLEIAENIHHYLPSCQTIGCFARVTDVTYKSDTDLRALRQAGYTGLTIGIESGDDEALHFMDKGYQASDIITQAQRLDAVGIGYCFFYLTGLSGAGRGEIGAKATAEVCNQLHPALIGANMLTVFPHSRLYREQAQGLWQAESELEKYRELYTLICHLAIDTCFAALGASNAVSLIGKLPQDKPKLLATLERIITSIPENDLQHYRQNLRHL